eukprot:scaffold29847_cov14-Tisochrysis_lutea.AAC.1
MHEKCKCLVHRDPPEPHSGVPSMPNQTLSPNKQIITLWSGFESVWLLSPLFGLGCGACQGDSAWCIFAEGINWPMLPDMLFAGFLLRV